MLAAFSLSSFTTLEPINEAVVKNFKKTYPEAGNVIWYQGNNYYQVSFSQQEIRTTMYFNNENQVYRTLRYYGENQLPPYIMFKLKQRYKNKEITGVTEMAEADMGVSYDVVLQDSQNIIMVHSDSYGNLQTTKKLKKSK